MARTKSRAELERAIKLGLIKPRDIVVVNDQAFVYDHLEVEDALKLSTPILGSELPSTKEGNPTFGGIRRILPKR